ncbi:PAS domain-containing sensor histidine kinase [Nocardioides lijunqiniae]|uniref:PAS domain-containing sensor histidine kinase n=1 Tax=Nocardioides lijunqiniae TaxID=2760832 RepID=UPI001878FB37|nr:ATP-binding protein [Nocardioides lijunqiniae]
MAAGDAEHRSDEDAQRLVAVERAMRETSERYRSLFEYHPNAVFSLDLEGRFTSANPSSQLLSGYSEAELLGMLFTDLLPPDELEPTLAAFLRLLDREPQRFEVQFLHKAGHLVDLSVTGLPIIVEDELVGAYGIAEDVTARNRMRAELDDARRAAEEASNAKSLFLANMSHEIRTPLTSVLAAAEMLSDTDLDDRQQRLAAVMDRQGAQLLRLVDEILDFSRVEAGKADLVRVPFALREVLTQAVGTQAAAAEGKGLALRLEVDERLDDAATGDPARLAQVLTNLVGNAVKFTETGSVRVQAEPGPPAPDGPTVLVAVTDTGIGVTPEQKDRLFTSFSQADPSITRRYGGTGLGLAICKELVTLMGGEIGLELPAEGGCRFSFHVPQHLPA